MENRKNILIERLGIVLLCAIYLILFNVELPNGDAYRIVRQIQASDLQWNPNHLLLDPIGYAWYHLLEYLNFTLTALESFEIITFISTVASLLLFHMVLIEAGIKQQAIRLFAVAALFASKNFIFLAVTQYYFMVQMPILLGALLYGVRYLSINELSRRNKNYLYIIGVLLALATGIEVNSILITFLAGLVLGFEYVDKYIWNWTNTARVWLASAIVGFPLFFTGYFASGVDSDFFTWALTYAGADDSALKQLYGLQFSLHGLILSAVKLAYNLLFGNFIETAGLGLIIKSIVFGIPLDFKPEYFRIILALILMPIVAFLQIVVFVWAFLKVRNNEIFLFLFVWIVSYLIFSFLWDNSGSIFLFQTLPAIILLFVYFSTSNKPDSNLFDKYLNRFRKKILLMIAAVVPALFILNTLSVVFPVAFVGMDEKAARHNDLLQNGDLEITTGWDKYQWMSGSEHSVKYTKLLLMNMVMKPVSDKEYIHKLPVIVKNHLLAGNRVIVARLYDFDSEPNPWNNFSRMGWTRENLQELLADFCNKKIEQIGDVVFREIYLCKL